MILLDNVIYISWGTSGIGAATVLSCLREWACVAFTGRNADGAHILMEELIKQGFSSDRVLFIACDVTKPQDIQASLDQTVNHFWSLYGVFANAGKHMVGTIMDTSLEQRKNMFAVDVEWVFLTLKYSIPHLQAWWSGSIVLMGSDQCLIGKAESSAYGAAKWAIGQLTKSTAIDFAKDHIRVNCVCPGTIDTPLARGAMQWFADKNFEWNFEQGYEFLKKAQPIQRLWTPLEVAELVTFLLSDKAWFMTGSLVSIDGGYVAG